MTIGRRLAEARAESGMTQAQLASAVGMARSVVAKIENETRRISAVELVSVARELDRRVEWFVVAGPQAVVSHRANRTEPTTRAIDTELERIVRDVEFVAEHAVGLIERPPATQRRPASPSESETLAADARRFLSLEPGEPVQDLSVLLPGIGLLPFAVHLGQGADAGTVLLQRGGVCLVNGDTGVGRRRLALAHELGHYLVADPYTTDWRVASADADALEARLDRFARALLLPEAALRQSWAEWRARPDESLRDSAVRAGSHYRVDMATLSRRLAELRIVDASEAADIRRVKTTQGDIVEKDLVVHRELEPVFLPRPYQQAVLSLYRSETVTSDRALGLLMNTFSEDDLPDLPAVPEGEIWSFIS
ncbi:XRE family transcriptional regulator [Streptomonospora litoralis]|uniref:Helix-turn-helix protein n=1 Tax=Streptomonospora litoralis TaxID=2498135 RepID=A0A4P6Q1M7_9ACTN|nr:XRE family transcriptional regulator [Streptomonospora litoralis]QBI52497.1 Helix-turn-helix protein [Streptomonospora litoralis]